MATDYWPQEEGEIGGVCIKIGFATAGAASSVVAYKGVRCYTADTAGELKVMLATTRQGWGIALKTVATAGDPVPILVFGVVKAFAGAACTRDLACTFDSAGRLVLLSDQAVNESGSSSYTVYYSAKVARALRSVTTANDEFIVLFCA